MYYTWCTTQYTHLLWLKCGRFHSAVAEALALVTAFSKEISNESCREASKALVRTEEPFSIESLKELASKVWFEVYFAVSAKTSIKSRRDWENFNMVIDQKRYENYLSLLFLWDEMVLQLFILYCLQNSKCSFHCCIALIRKTLHFQRIPGNRQTHNCNPPPTRSG